jgi:hypothetical protein
MTNKIEDNSHEKIVEGVFNDVSELELDNEDELASILAEIDGDAGDVVYTMGVWRIPKIGKRIWLFDCDPSEPVKSKLRDEYGTGKYELRVRRNNLLFRRPVLKVEAPLYPSKAAPAGRGDRSSDGDIISMIEESNRRMIEVLGKIIPSAVAATPPADPVTQMSAMMGVMMQFKEFTAPADTGEKTTQLEKFKEMMELKKLFGGGEGDANNSDIILAAIEHIGGPLSKMTQQQAAETQRRSANALVAKKSTNKKKRDTEPNDEMTAMRMGVSVLVSGAQRNEDPAPYVDIIFARIARERIETFLTGGDALQLLSTVNPAVAQHPKWFGELGDLVRERLSEEDKTENDGALNERTKTSSDHDQV